MIDQDRLTNFMSIYATNLSLARKLYPEGYCWPDSEFQTVIKRMTDAVERGSYNKDGHAFRATCKDLGIKHTYKAISEYLRRS
jgi:hypothetical protein